MSTRTADVVARADFRDLFAEFKRTGRVVAELNEELGGLGAASAGVDKLGRAVSVLSGHAAQAANDVPRVSRAAEKAAAGIANETQKQARAQRQLVIVRKEAADVVAHELALVRARGDAQGEAIGLLRKESRLRRSIAEIDNGSGSARTAARRAELRVVEAIHQESEQQERDAMQARHEQADSLRHAAQVVEAMGGDQAKIDELVAREAAVRRQIAVLEGDTAAARKISQASELRAARRVFADTKAASKARKAASERAQALDDEQAASRHRALEAEIAALRRQAEVREVAGIAALRIEERILGVQLRQARGGAAKTADDRHRKEQRVLDLQAKQLLMSRKLAAANRAIFPDANFAKIKGNFQQVASQATNVAMAIGAIVAGAAALDRLVEQSIKLDAVFGNLPFGIEDARTATKGLVGDMELAQAAIEAQRLQVVDSEEDFARLAGAAVKLGLSVGRGAAESVHDLTAALGKGETELLDNLGIKLRVSEAEKAYAQRLGVSRTMLTDTQKAEAFRTVGMLKTLEAAEGVNIEIDSGAKKWNAMKQQAAKLGREVLPKIIDTLEVLLDVLGFYAKAWVTVFEAVDDVIMQGFELVDVLTLGEDATRTMTRGLGALDGAAQSSTSWLMTTAKAYEDLSEKAQLEASAKAAESAQQKEIVARDASIARAKQTLWLVEKQVKTMEAEGKSQERLNGLIDAQVALEATVLEQQGKELEAEKLLFANEIRKKKERKKRSQEWAQAHQERLSQEREASLAEVEARRSIAAAQGELHTRSIDRHRVETDLLRLAREQLDVREASARGQRGNSSETRHKKEQELLAVTTQRRLLDVQAIQLEQEREQELAQWRVASIERELEQHESLGLAVDELRERRRQAAVAVAFTFGSEDEFAQASHEAEIERRSEKQEHIAEEHATWLEQRDRELEVLAASGQNIDHYYASRFDLEAKLAKAEGDHEGARQARHKAEMARMRREAHVRKQVHGTINSLVTGSAEIATFAAEVGIKSDKKREAVFKRVQGGMAIARGAVELVEGVAAAARYDYVSAVQHFIASGLGFAKGAVLLSGGLPSADKGSGGGGGAANSGAYLGAANDSGSSGGGGNEAYGSGERSTPLSGTGVTGEELDRASQGTVGSSASGVVQHSSTININAPIVSNDSAQLLSQISKSGTKSFGDLATG